MSSTLRALLIASPYGELRGPENDVESMARVLTKYGFELTECYGPEATRANILQRWRDIINNSSDGDTVVIYYSGHGGIVDSSGDTRNQQGDLGKPLRSQFLVPMDFDQTTDGDFRGILDIEISYLLRETTNKTKNVSIILDCCHAGRMARDPHHIRRAWPRNLPEIKHHSVLREHEQRFRREGQLTGDTSVEGNKHAVRIAAAATTESAWEYLNSQEEPVGVLTEALVAAMEKAHGQRLSWRTIMLGVCEFVNREFPQQHPRAEGPDARILFSEEQSTSGALAVTWEGDSAMIRGGRVAGVHEGNEYDIMPLGSEVVDEKIRIAVAKVEFINGFKAKILTTSGTIPPEGALAFLQKETLPALFVSFPSDLPALGEKLKASRFLRCNEPGEGQTLVDIKKEDDRLVVRKGATVLATYPFTEATIETAIDAVVSDGERLARGHHFLALQSGEGDEELATTIDIAFGQVEDGACLGPLTKDGTAMVKENQRIYIKLRNSGDAKVFVSIFDVNVNGTIGLISGGLPRGIELVSGKDYELGKTQFGGTMKGLGLSWPKTVPKAKYVDETLVFVVSSEEVSLQHLAYPKRSVEPKGRVSRLERITYQLASGQARTVESYSQSRCIRYAVYHIPFTLHNRDSIELRLSPSNDTSMTSRLDATISKAKETVAATPANHSDRAMYLNNLGNKLDGRYKNREDKQQFLQVVDETIRKDCAGRFDTDLCEVTFGIVWQLQQCIKDELDSNADLGSVLTVSGDSSHSWAISCREYVETTWSTLGMAFFEKIELVLGKASEAEASDQDLRKMQVNLVSSDAEAEGDSSSVSYKGTVSEISILAQLLSWIAATFRLPQTGELSCSTVSFRSRNSKPTADLMLTYSLQLEPLQPLDNLEEGTCWKRLFPSTVMAYGFPVPICPRTLGLQIPFGAMLELAEILYDVTLEDDEGHYAGVYLDGVFWTLYPTKYIEEGNTVQWHLIRKPTGKELGQSLTPDHFGGPAWFRKVDLMTLASATAILGYCAKVEIRLGTESRLQQYKEYSHSKAKIEHPSPEASIGSASLGFSILGRAATSLTASFKPRKGLVDAQKEAKDMSYSEVLERTETEPVILFETEGGNERAWMVPQLSLILDLLNFWIYCKGKEKVKKGVKYAKLDSNGGARAKEVLEDPEYANKIVIKHILKGEPDIRIGDMVTQIYGQILKRMIKDAESDEGARGTKSVGKTGIRGWDLLELTYLGGSIARRRDVQPIAHGLRSGTKPCWMPLAKMIPVLVGQHMGELMTPEQTDQVCRHWFPLPGGFKRNYMAASIKCLRKVATYYGNEACWELVDNLGWDFKDQSIFQPCVKCMEYPNLCTKHPQLLVKRTNKLQKKSPSGINLPPFNLPQDGAIIFGEKRKDEREVLGTAVRKEICNNGVP